jgi:hypothetical protein
MRTALTILFLAILITSCKEEKTKNREHNYSEDKVEQLEPAKKTELSPHTSTMEMIGDAHIHIDYSSPGVRNRIIFGGLLAYDMVWQAGAHKATWLETNKDLIIDGKILPAGKYGFFTIPSKDEWTLIFNTNWDQHGKDDYDEIDDVLRFKIKPVTSEDITEHLVYKINKIRDNEGSISLTWEKVSLKFNFELKD